VGVFAALDRGERRLVGACCSALLSGAVLSVGCLPREDLSDYSGSSSGQGAAIQDPSTESAGGAAGGLTGSGGSETGPDPMLPLNPGGAEAGSAGVEDAGALLDAEAVPAPEPDAGGDAGPIANQCTSTQGTLEPGSTVCLFFASLARVTWQAADLACQSRDSDLVSVKSLARNDFLTTLIGTTDIWIGAQDPGANPGANAFVWRDGTVVGEAFDPWATGEPDAVIDQFCVSKTGEPAAPPGPAAPWRDRTCSELKAYVCEQTLQ
jgi:hypothetical protein